MTSQAQFPDEQSGEGVFIRQPDAFQSWVTANGSSGYPAASGRYHLYVSWACPWAHRTIIVRKLKNLGDVIGMTVVDPIRDERGWAFREGPGHSFDPINNFQFLSQAYKATDPNYRGRFTVPVLWDTETQRIVTNSDDDLLLIRLPFNLLHGVLKMRPFCWCDDLKLKAELPLAAPPDNRSLNLNGRFALGDLDSNLESGPWLHINRTFDATALHGEIQEAPLSTDQSDGGK